MDIKRAIENLVPVSLTGRRDRADVRSIVRAIRALQNVDPDVCRAIINSAEFGIGRKVEALRGLIRLAGGVDSWIEPLLRQSRTGFGLHARMTESRLRLAAIVAAKLGADPY